MTEYTPFSGEPPLCINCRHLTWDEGATCERPLSGSRSVVDGEFVSRIHAFCCNERQTGKTLFTRRERCGYWGRYFEQAPPAISAASVDTLPKGRDASFAKIDTLKPVQEATRTVGDAELRELDK